MASETQYKSEATGYSIDSDCDGVIEGCIVYSIDYFGIPREKYDEWQTMTLTFNPGEMF